MTHFGCGLVLIMLVAFLLVKIAALSSENRHLEAMMKHLIANALNQNIETFSDEVAEFPDNMKERYL